MCKVTKTDTRKQFLLSFICLHSLWNMCAHTLATKMLCNLYCWNFGTRIRWTQFCDTALLMQTLRISANRASTYFTIIMYPHYSQSETNQSQNTVAMMPWFRQFISIDGQNISRMFWMAGFSIWWIFYWCFRIFRIFELRITTENQWCTTQTGEACWLGTCPATANASLPVHKKVLWMIIGHAGVAKDEIPAAFIRAWKLSIRAYVCGTIVAMRGKWNVYVIYQSVSMSHTVEYQYIRVEN
jgi:hypothetical protein